MGIGINNVVMQQEEIPSAAAASSLLQQKRSHCIIFPTKVDLLAQSLQTTNNHWFVKTKASSDLTIQIEDKSFHLHKISMASRSGYISRIAFQANGSSSSAESNIMSSIEVDNIPGGAKTFELVVRFCYGLKINATASNIAPLYCAAHFLEMNDDLHPENLISKTEAFLSFVILSSWKDTFRVVRSCESITMWAKNLHIVKHCSESIAWKACSETTNPNSIVSIDEALKNTDWWFEDASTLRIDHFIELITTIKRRKTKPELVGSCIAHWTSRWISRAMTGKENSNNDDDDLSLRLNRATLECLIRVLPCEEHSVTSNFLLQIFKAGKAMRIAPGMSDQVRMRVAMMLESCKVEDLLVKNYTNTGFDVEIVVEVVQDYVFHHLSTRKGLIGKLVYEYLALVARDENLSAKTFQMLVQVLPREAQSCDDNLYRAIDIYLKAHPNLTDEERQEICRVLEYHKLSQEARKHVAMNDRLSERIRAQFILLEQVSLARCSSSEYERTKPHAVMRINKGLRRGSISTHINDVRVMRKDVEMLKMQVGKLQLCRTELQRHLMNLKKPAVI